MVAGLNLKRPKNRHFLASTSTMSQETGQKMVLVALNCQDLVTMQISRLGGKLFSPEPVDRLRVVPYFSSGIVERAKRERTCRLFSRGVIFTRARVSLALPSLRKNGGLLVV